MGASILSLYNQQANTHNRAVIIFFYGMSIATVNASRHFKKKINGKIKFSENITLTQKNLEASISLLFARRTFMFYVLFSYIL